MPNFEAATSKRAVLISPNVPMLEDLAPFLGGRFAHLQRLTSYPSPQYCSEVFGSGTPYIAFLDASSDQDQALHLLSEITRMNPSVQIVTVLNGDDPDFILRCLRSGAVDFITQPFSSDQIEAVFSKLSRQKISGDSSGRESAKLIIVMPAKGACGATTIASNLAFQWKRHGASRVLLADLDPLTGTLSFVLKIKSGFSFLDALQRAHELDLDLWKAMVTEVHGVDVLLAPELLLDNAQDVNDPSPILEFARNNYDVVVADAASVYGNWNLNLARAASEVILVTTNELPALQAAQRALSYLDSNRIGRWKVKLVVNRYTRDVGLSRDVIGTALHTDVYETVPNDYDAVQKGLLEGKPISTSTAFGKSILQLTEQLGGRKEKTSKKSSSLGGLLNLFSKTSK